MAVDPTDDVKTGTDSSPAPDVKEKAPASSASAGATTDSPPAKKASETPTPPPGKSNREALIASLSQEKKDEATKSAEGDEPKDDAPKDEPAVTDPVDAPADEGGEPAAETTTDEPAEGDETEVTGKPERAKKDVLIENLRKVSAEKKALEPFQRFATPILTKLSAAKIPPAEFHQLTDTFIGARAKGLPAEKITAWVNLGAETLSAPDAAQRLYEMAVQHGYQPAAPAVPVVPPEDEAWISAQEKAGLFDAEQASRARKMAARAPAAPAPRPRAPQPPPPQQQPPALAEADVNEALSRVGALADAVRAQHKISDVDWEALDKQIVAKLNQAKDDAGGEIPVKQWPSTFKLVTDAVVADYLRRRPAATKSVQPSLRPSKAPGGAPGADLSEREKVIRRFSAS